MFYCIVNPAARSGHGKEIWKKLEYMFLEKNIEFKAFATRGPGDGSRLARKITTSEDFTKELPLKLVVLGGDGTINEVLNGIDDLDKVLIGYIPIGSSNDFARDLDYPDTTEELLDTIVKGEKVRSLDLGKLTFNTMTPKSDPCIESEAVTRIFDVSSGIGFDAAVCEEALHSGTKSFLNRIGLGKLTYGLIAVRQLLKAPKVPCDIILDTGETVHLEKFIFIAAMIHHYEGGGFKFAPKSDMTDGKFDLVYAGDMPTILMFFALPFAFFGNYFWIRGVGHNLVEKVTIKTRSPMWVHTDGEVSVQSDNITYECLKQRLHMMN